jgi:hypothetical protein
LLLCVLAGTSTAAPGDTTRASVATAGTQANGGSATPSISSDGRYVAFTSFASNLVADDTNGNTDVFVHELTWLDSTPPAIEVPADITVNATRPSGATVSYDAVTATDELDPNPTVSCDHESGSIFPIGTTPVTCTATDASGNTATASFNVIVKGAVEQINDLKSYVASLNIQAGLKRSLQAKLDDALAYLNAGSTTQACTKLSEFISQVNAAQSGGQIPTDDAQKLTEDATRIKGVVGC